MILPRFKNKMSSSGIFKRSPTPTKRGSHGLKIYDDIVYCKYMEGAFMNAIKELRNTTGMSQSKFALYLGIPVANIQHWEQGKTTPPDYVTSLISRVMKNDGYIEQEYTTAQIDMLRQTQATLAIEELGIGRSGVNAIGKVLKGEISREDYQKMLKENYKVHGKH